MKKTAYVLIFALVLVFLIGALSSCSDNNDVPAQVTEVQFADALKVTDKNLSFDIYYEYDGDVLRANVKVADGKAYYKSENDSYWFDFTDNEVLFILRQMAEQYSAFTYADGSYTLGEMTYTYDDYEYKVVNLSCKVLSSGKLSEVCFEVPEEDCNRSYKLTFGSYGSTSAPSSEDIFTEEDNGGNTGNGGNGPSNQPGGDSSNSGNGDDKTGSVSEDGWRKAFAFSDMNFCAHFKSNSPDGYSESKYMIVDGEGYYTIQDENDWVRGSVEEFTGNFAPFVELYSDFEFDGTKYKCSESSYVPGQNAKIIDLEAMFDEDGRLVYFAYTLELNGEQGRMDVYIEDYDNVTAPELSNSSSSGDKTDKF